VTAGTSGGDAPTGWRRGADAATEIREVVARSARHDGVAAVSGHVLDALDSGSADYLLTTVSGSIAGVAVALGADPGEVVVEPGSRGRGLGSVLVAAVVDRQGAVWAYGDLPAAAAVARRLELRRGRVLLQMRRTLSGGAAGTPIPGSHGLPAGVRVRTFVPGQDEEAFLAVNARAFAWHPEQGRLDLAGLRAEMAQGWFDPAGFFLAVSDTAGQPERLLGFHWTKVHPADPGEGADARSAPIGEIYVLGVDPQAGVRGLGTPLTAIGLHHLQERGLDTVMLYVEGDNDRARRLYERFGFVVSSTNVVYLRSAAPSR
jgi:mycothiol synthase